MPRMLWRIVAPLAPRKCLDSASQLGFDGGDLSANERQLLADQSRDQAGRARRETIRLSGLHFD